VAHFIHITISEYDPDGTPVPDSRQHWLNTDHITQIEEHLGNNLVRRHRLQNQLPEQHYPCLLITTSDGTTRLISLGTTPTQHAGTIALTNPHRHETRTDQRNHHTSSARSHHRHRRRQRDP